MLKRVCALIGACVLITIAVAVDVYGQEDVAARDLNPLTLWYDQPANVWMTEALPIGNGPMGAMLFGGTETERIQFNEISLWSGDRMPRENDIEEENMGAHQAFGDIFIRLGHDQAKVKNYKRQLDIDRAIHMVEYDYEGVHYKQTAFASHPAHVIVIHLTADKSGAYSGRIWLTDMHGAQINLAKNRLYSVGKFDNGFEYEAQVHVLHQGGDLKRAAPKNSWKTPMSPSGQSFKKCDAVTLILGAGTSFEQDYAKEWLGEHPHARVTKQVDLAAAQSTEALMAAHVRDYQSLFGRVSFDLGQTASELLAKSTVERLETYTNDHSVDPELEALFCQFGRYLLISCSRPGALPANLQGIWNHSNQPAWAGDYHSNINLERRWCTNQILS